MGKNKKTVLFSDEVSKVLSDQKTKIFVIDTSVMVHDSKAINKFGDNLIIVPIWNIEELDKLKSSFNGKGFSAREASRMLDHYCQRGSLKNGVLMDNGGVLIVDYSGNGFSELPVGLEKTNDNRTIVIARKWKKMFPEKEVIVVSKDTNLRIKADSCGVVAQDFKGDKKISDIGHLYSGLVKFYVNDKSVIDNLYHQGSEIIEDEQFIEKPTLLVNSCCRIFHNDKYSLAIYKGDNYFKLVRKYKKQDTEIGRSIRPSNDEQCLAYNLLIDKDISLVTLGGHAGTGKTLIALLAGLEHLDKEYDQIIVYRPSYEIGQPMGFLPGDIKEKFAPWTLPIVDNLRLILRSDDKSVKKEQNHDPDSLISSGKITIEPLNFIRGRSINKSFIIVDEAQNIRPEDAKTVITRAGAGTKVVLVGDVTQIDNPYVDPISNGLTSVIEGFKGDSEFGHITLTESRRSRLSEKAARFL